MPTDNSNLTKTKSLLIDMDGVLWRNETPLPGLQDFFLFLRNRNIPFLLTTNNASKTPYEYVDKGKRMGVTLSSHEILTSSQVTASYLQKHYPAKTKIHALGMNGLRQALTQAGFILADDGVAAVVVGIDFELSYNKLKKATLLINQGADFIGTNGDASFPSEEGLVPGNGALLAALSTATGKKPTVIGKPERFMFEESLVRLKTKPDETAIIGDRLDTDILGAKRAGIKAILVLSGVTKAGDLAGSEIQADWVFQDIAELTGQWKTMI